MGGTLRVVQNVPQITMDAAVLAAVNRQCQPIDVDDFESFGLAFGVASSMTLSTIAELELDKGLTDIGLPDSWEHTLWSQDIPFFPAPGSNDTGCFVLTDGGDSASDSNTSQSATASAVRAASPIIVGMPTSTGILFSAALAVPTWDMGKIESFYAANGHLPTNVNYTQMVQATAVPSNISNALNKAAKQSGGTTTIGMASLE